MAVHAGVAVEVAFVGAPDVAVDEAFVGVAGVAVDVTPVGLTGVRVVVVRACVGDAVGLAAVGNGVEGAVVDIASGAEDSCGLTGVLVGRRVGRVP
ncbi:MAG: hypothetical protein M1343_04935 [Chloroflexi bacterium]|nr:hypothetical protein [Chloroflexota bacterium]MDA8188031.1 hypothetical protein [Dehalococcoidales bacterium]